MQNNNAYIILLIVGALIFFDFSNFDRTMYLFSCNVASSIFPVICTNFYDIPIWEATITFGTIAAAYFAYAAIAESNKRLEIEQTPHLVFSNHIGSAHNNNLNQLINVQLKNIGKGRAVNVRITADDKKRISIVEGSNSNSIDLKEGENMSWAIDEGQVIKGLKVMGTMITSTIFETIPDENILDENEKDKSDLYLYLWYEDQLHQKYKTIGKFRHCGHFFKHMESKALKI